MGIFFLACIVPEESVRSYTDSDEDIEFARITLWIDKENHAILRRDMVESARKYLSYPPGERAESKEVLLHVRDTFQDADLTGPLPDELFQFIPPTDAREVVKGQAQRQKPKAEDK